MAGKRHPHAAKDSGPKSLLEAVVDSLAGSTRHSPGEVAPVAVLWTDPDGQWRSLFTLLRDKIPHLFTLGTYSPDQHQGPAIWLRCIVDRTLPEFKIPTGIVPILYLPDVSRQMLRAAEDCPPALAPLVELPYRGTVWCQRNSKDWTIEAFLVSADVGLSLDLAKDSSTRRAMIGSLAQLAVTPLDILRGRRLEAEDFDRLMIEDTPRNLLEWMNDPKQTRTRWPEERWAAFRSRCKAEYGFDPQNDGELVAGEHLGLREHAWNAIWERFLEAPALYPGLPALLRKAKPDRLPFEKETWPDENDHAEESLRRDLLKLLNLPASEARKKLADLEKEHGERRGWVWAKLGQSPLVLALEHLQGLSQQTASNLGGDTLNAMAEAYSNHGFLADDLALRAMASVKTAEDVAAVSAAVRSLYLPWLQDTTEHFQKLMNDRKQNFDPSVREEATTFSKSGTCWLFVDGLRFDIGQRLRNDLQSRGLRVSSTHSWAALPTVTGTAKPAAAPIFNLMSGQRPGDDFVPTVAATGQTLNADRFKKLLLSRGFQIVAPSETGDSKASEAMSWSEYGEFDKLGHSLQAKLAHRIEDQLELLCDRIEDLLTAGWHQVHVCTDHGWLLVPGGLPSVSLPKFLTESRWSRCATMKSSANVTVPTINWHWNPSEHVAVAPGVACFGGGFEYAHGGISLQECVIPHLVCCRDLQGSENAVEIVDIQWLNMRCRVTSAPAGISLTADLRTRINDSASSVTTPKPVDASGKVGLMVIDESLEGTAVSLVLLDGTGQVVAKKPTTVGGGGE
jgi:hypothetical protein